MHSSRMRTVHCSGRLRVGEDYLSRMGCLPRGVSALGVSAWGFLLRGVVCPFGGGCVSPGVDTPRRQNS